MSKKRTIERRNTMDEKPSHASHLGSGMSQPAATDRPTIGRGWRMVICLLGVLHILAVFAEPFRFFSQSPVKFAAEDARWLRMATRAYSDFMYLSHGYSFFAPNPGPSHLLECEIRPTTDGAEHTQPSITGRPVIAEPNRQGGSQSSWKVFPDRHNDWPRLLYHRHFMLSEFYHSQFAPVTLAEQADLDAAVLEQWRSDRQQYQQLQSSIRNNLTQHYPGRPSVLRRIEHALPSEYQIFVEHWKLTDPRLYAELPEGDAPTAPQESIPRP